MHCYLVGGAVRDALLGLPVQERDWVVVGGTPEALIEQGYKPVGKDFPVFLHPETGEEYALARTERKVKKGYHGFVFNTAPDISLEDDLRRRDLTINAMARTQDGRVIDPFGGQQDLQARLLRHVSPAFDEDPVRLLRLARFAARFAHLGFSIAEDTQAHLKTMVDAGEIDELQSERVWQEWYKALQTQTPRCFIDVLRHCGALARLTPEINALFTKKMSTINQGEHALLTLERVCPHSIEAHVRFAALIHSLDTADIKHCCARLPVPKTFQELAILCAKYHQKAHGSQAFTAAQMLDFLENVDAFRRPQRFTDFLLICQAAKQSSPGSEHEPYPQAEQLQMAYQAAAALNAKIWVAQGLSGLEIKKALQKHRIAAIEKLSGS